MFCAFWLASVLRAPAACHFSTIVRHPRFKKWPETLVCLEFWLARVLLATAACTFWCRPTSKSAPPLRCFAHFDLQMCFAAQRRAHFSTSKLPKVSQDRQFFSIFDLQMCFVPQRRAIFRRRKCRNCGPSPSDFLHFDLQMCFAPQRRATFPHPHFQKCSEGEVF